MPAETSASLNQVRCLKFCLLSDLRSRPPTSSYSLFLHEPSDFENQKAIALFDKSS